MATRKTGKGKRRMARKPARKNPRRPTARKAAPAINRVKRQALGLARRLGHNMTEFQAAWRSGRLQGAACHGCGMGCSVTSVPQKGEPRICGDAVTRRCGAPRRNPTPGFDTPPPAPHGWLRHLFGG
jgi:hypothetical protein